MANSTTRKPATPEEFWGMLREASERQKEIDKCWERLEIEGEKDRAESAKAREVAEKDRQESAQHRAEIEKDRKEMRKHMKDLSNLFRGQWGKFMESLVRGDLLKLLAERGRYLCHATGLLCYSGNGGLCKYHQRKEL